MRHPILRLALPVVTGVLLFAAGFWAGRRNTAAPSGPTRDPGAAEAYPVAIPGSSGFPRPGMGASPGEGSGGGSGGGAAIALLPGNGAPADLRTALENPNQRSRERDLEAIGARDFATGSDWQKSADSIGDLVDRSFYLKGVVSSWAAADPQEAVTQLSTMPLSSRASLIPHAVSIWAERDPAGAEQWVLALGQGEVRDRAVESLYRSWAVNDPETAAARSLALGDESARFRALSAVVKEWSANDLGAVGKWASGLTDPNLKDFATMAVADEMSARAPKEAMRWASEHLAKDPRANPDILPLVASKAGFEAPQETFAWLQSVPSSPEANSSLAGVATYLIEENPDFAWTGFPKLSENLQQVTAGPVASTLGAQNPEEGKRWLAQLPDGEMKRWATTAFAAGWVSRHPAEAGAWVAGLPSSPEKQAAEQGLQSAIPGVGASGRAP
jgi:hypothetical protein